MELELETGVILSLEDIKCLSYKVEGHPCLGRRGSGFDLMNYVIGRFWLLPCRL